MFHSNRLSTDSVTVSVALISCDPSYPVFQSFVGPRILMDPSKTQHRIRKDVDFLVLKMDNGFITNPILQICRTFSPRWAFFSVFFALDNLFDTRILLHHFPWWNFENLPLLGSWFYQVALTDHEVSFRALRIGATPSRRVSPWWGRTCCTSLSGCPDSSFATTNIKGSCYLQCLFPGLNEVEDDTTDGVRNEIHHKFWFCCDSFFSWILLKSFCHRSGASCGAEMADVKQGQQMIPLIACETSFGQNVSKFIFGVDAFDLDFGIQIDSIKQPIKWNVSPGNMSHCRTPSSDNHLNHCFVFFEHIQ